jgi:hypothetical protein
MDDVPDPGSYPSGGSHSDPVEHFAGSGGHFDGGGASAGFDDGGSGQLVATKAELASGAAGAGEFAVPLLAIVAVLAVFGAWGWAIAATPSVLIETAIEVAVASGLIRSMSRTRSSTWFESLFSRTIAKALLLALSALLIGFAVRMVDPSADTLGEAIARLLSR